MWLDGKKYACDACVRGHRVTGCQHSDRPLLEIAKKGRPVSQCQHCRTLRKFRSSHVKCECGDRAKGLLKHHYINEHGVVCELSEPKETCPCPHGGRCNCSIKKEPQEHSPRSIPVSGSSIVKDAAKKPRLQSIQSEGSLTKFASGYRPLHRHNSYHSKLPYQRPQHIQNADHIQLTTENSRISGEPWGELATGLIHPPLALSEIQNVPPYIKQEINSPDIGFANYGGESDFSGQSDTLNNISDFALPPTTSFLNLSLQTDLPQYHVSDHVNEQFYSANGSDAGSQYSTFFTPTSMNWPYETTIDSMYDFVPGLSQSVSGDDSEVDTFGLHRLPSPAQNIPPPLFQQGPLSTHSSDFYEFDEPANLSSHSSSIGLSKLGITSGTNLATMNKTNLTSALEPLLPEAVLEKNLKKAAIPNNTYSDTRGFETDSFTEVLQPTSYFPPDHEVLMMLPPSNPVNTNGAHHSSNTNYPSL